MGDKSKIQWTEATWNPTTGCSRVSAGCDNCYAIRQAHRIQHMGTTQAYNGTTRETNHGIDWTGVLNCHPDRLDQPLRWTKPRRVFVNSMSDLFHPAVPVSFIDEVFAVMALSSQHTFQILTKRPERMAEYLADAEDRIEKELDRRFEDGTFQPPHYVEWFPKWPLPNVWLGASIEDQFSADKRIPELIRCPAAVRFLSYEPALGPVDLELWLDERSGNEMWAQHLNTVCGIQWVIVGGESGPGARVFDVEWARSIVQQCKAAGVAVFVKQLGRHPHKPSERDGATGYYLPLSDPKGGDPSEWPEDLRVREFPIAQSVPAQ